MKSKLITIWIYFGVSTCFADMINGSYVIESLPGCYSQQSESDQPKADYTYDAVSIATGVSNENTVSIHLSRDYSSLPTQTYLCDSKEHSGDGNNTGDTYIAHCKEDSMEIRRVFKQLKFPLIVKYKKIDSGVEMVETFEGSSFKRQCSFIPIDSRYFFCEAEDKIGRTSLLRIYADSNIIEQKDTGDLTSKWTMLYDENKACGQKILSAKCTRRLVHNLGQPNQPYDAAHGSNRCEKVDGKPVVELNANFEINRTGDGFGLFKCGILSKNDLTLTKCKSGKN